MERGEFWFWTEFFVSMFVCPRGIDSPRYMYVYDLYPRLNPVIVPIIRFVGIVQISFKVTIYLCRMYLVPLCTTCQSDNMCWCCLWSPLLIQVPFARCGWQTHSCLIIADMERFLGVQVVLLSVWQLLLQELGFMFATFLMCPLSWPCFVFVSVAWS